MSKVIRHELIERIKEVGKHAKLMEIVLFDYENCVCQDGDDIKRCELLFSDGQAFDITIEEMEALGKYKFQMGIDFQ